MTRLVSIHYGCKRSGFAALGSYVGMLLLLVAVSQAAIAEQSNQRPGSAKVERIPGSRVVIRKADYDAFTFVRKREHEPRAPRVLEHPAVFEVTYVDFPQEAQDAFEYALGIWSALIESEVPIKVQATWEPLPDDKEPNEMVLGAALPTAQFQNFHGAPTDDFYFASALADSLARADNEPGGFDIEASFNSVSSWYFHTDGMTEAGTTDFASVVLHEIGHAIGFVGSMRVDDGMDPIECDGTLGVGCFGYDLPHLPYIYDLYAQDGLDMDLTGYEQNSLALGNQLITGVYNNSPGAVGANGSYSVGLFTPNPFEPGSSYSHLDEEEFPPGNPNSLMTPVIGGAEAIHDPGDVALCMLEDMGWHTVAICEGGGLIGPTVYLNQAAACQGFTVISQYFPDLMFGLEAADDFVVPEGEMWSIDRIDVGGIYFNDGVADSVNLTIYQDDASSPGAFLCSYPDSLPIAGTISPVFEFHLAIPCNLGPGRYWLSAQAVMDLDEPGPDQHQWNWVPNGFTANGEGYYWRDPFDATGGGCVGWTPHTECPVLTWDEAGQDLCFHLGGPPEPDDSWLDEIFHDGFESGNSGRWSTVFPVP